MSRSVTVSDFQRLRDLPPIYRLRQHVSNPYRRIGASPGITIQGHSTKRALSGRPEPSDPVNRDSMTLSMIACGGLTRGPFVLRHVDQQPAPDSTSRIHQ